MTKRSISKALAALDERLEQDQTLTAADREQIREKAKEHVAKKRRDKAEADYLARAIREEERSFNPSEALEDVTVNLAPFVASQKFSASFISLDGVQFFHGLTYEVPYSVARTMEDIMARGWEHEREIHGERRRADTNRRPMSVADPTRARVSGANL